MMYIVVLVAMYMHVFNGPGTHHSLPGNAMVKIDGPATVQIANSDMERFWRLVNTDVRDTLQPRLPELRPSACEAMISGLQKL